MISRIFVLGILHPLLTVFLLTVRIYIDVISVISINTAIINE